MACWFLLAPHQAPHSPINPRRSQALFSTRFGFFLSTYRDKILIRHGDLYMSLLCSWLYCSLAGLIHCLRVRILPYKIIRDKIFELAVKNSSRLPQAMLG